MRVNFSGETLVAGKLAARVICGLGHDIGIFAFRAGPSTLLVIQF